MKRILWSCAVLALPLWGHPGEQLQLHDLWTAWEFDPGTVIPIVLSGFAYYLGVYRAGGSIPRSRVLAFTAGWFALILALLSPIHPLGESLFCAHMTQHEILMLVAAPLLVLSQPLVPFLWALPFKWRRVAGHWCKTPGFLAAWKFITHAGVAWTIGFVVLWVWHLPFLFQSTLKSDLMHAAQHLSFLFAALLFWWAVFPSNNKRTTLGMSVLCIFTTGLHSGILGALLTISPVTWYPAYAATTRTWGLTPLEDQQIGGLIMWIPASLVYLGTGLWLFARWLRESELRVGYSI